MINSSHAIMQSYFAFCNHCSVYLLARFEAPTTGQRPVGEGAIISTSKCKVDQILHWVCIYNTVYKPPPPPPPHPPHPQCISPPKRTKEYKPRAYIRRFTEVYALLALMACEGWVLGNTEAICSNNKNVESS